MIYIAHPGVLIKQRTFVIGLLIVRPSIQWYCKEIKGTETNLVNQSLIIDVDVDYNPNQ